MKDRFSGCLTVSLSPEAPKPTEKTHNLPEVAVPKDSARETYDASDPRASCMFVGIGPQHEVIAAHSSRWPFGAQLLEERKAPGPRPDRG